LSPSTLSIGPGKIKKTINVTASQPTCPWTASSDVLWMVITSGASGTGNGKVTVQIDANPDPTARTGHLTIAGLTVVVTQDKH
jgi:hypothetical protein